MRISIFGKELFSFKTAKQDHLYGMAVQELNRPESKFLPDFQSFNGSNWVSIEEISTSYTLMNVTGTSTTDASGVVAVPMVKTDSKGKKVKKEFKPKEIHKMQMLNDRSFKLGVDPAYVDAQLQSFKDKLALISSEEYDMRNGVQEISSIVVRLENRKKYADHKEFFEQFPYTTNSRIQSVIKKHDYLKLGQVAQFIADMPKEATDAMKRYNEETKKLCGKQAVFYIIANKKDFKKSDSRRDPILLAQSPFGHVWQVLGAWDEEMLFLEEL